MNGVSLSTAAAQPAIDPRVQRTTDTGKAAKMLEGLFLRQLMKIMRKTVPDSGLMGGGLGKSIYTEMFDGVIADRAAGDGGLGLAAELGRQLGQASTGARMSAQRAAATFRRVANEPQLPALGGIAAERPDRPEPVGLGQSLSSLAPPLAQGELLDSASGLWRSRGDGVAVSAGAGQVVATSSRSITVDHGGGLTTSYAALKNCQAQVGDLVLKGQQLGELEAAKTMRFKVMRGGQVMELSKIKGLNTQ